ncbi:MAG TPA: hypothetical protein VF618_26205 [Thermoanaerobaculia bacterium]
MALSRNFAFLRTLCWRLAAKPRVKIYREMREIDRIRAREIWAEIQIYGDGALPKVN